MKTKQTSNSIDAHNDNATKMATYIAQGQTEAHALSHKHAHTHIYIYMRADGHARASNSLHLPSAPSVRIASIAVHPLTPACANDGFLQARLGNSGVKANAACELVLGRLSA